MNHSTSFCAAGSAILFLMSVASSAFASRARSMASFTSARSPVSGAMASLGAGEGSGRFALRCAEACLACRFFPGAALREERVSFPACDFLVASCAFWACGLWLARAVASVEKRVSPANVKRQDSERRHRFIPWSPCETHVTNAVKTKRSRDACGPELFERYHNSRGTISRLRNKNAQMSDWNPKSSSVRVGIAFDRGRSGPAGLNAARKRTPAPNRHRTLEEQGRGGSPYP